MVRTRPDGQVVARVFPENSIDQFLLNGVQAEIWLEPGATAPEISDHVAGAYRGGRPSGRVALVLGAGNVSSIPPLDVLHKMLVEHRTVLLKMNPVNDYLGPIFEDVFEPLVKDGFMAIARGGPEVGAHLAAHPGIDEIHMTGSDRTHDAIVWGTDGEAIERKRRGTPLNERPVTSELGNVTPLIVVPGPWDAADLRFQAEHIAATKLHNSGFNCIATQVLVMPEAWDRGNDMIDAVREIFRRVPPRRAYYPGAAERQQAIAHSHPGAEVLDDRPANEVPRLLLTDLSAADPDEPFFTQECFVSSMGTVAISGASAADYLRNAVDFCNERLWGTLGVRSLLALPGHVIFATTWGYALGRQKFDPTYRVWPMVVLAALLHGLYDFLLVYGPTRPLILLYMSLMVPVIVRQIRLLRADSPFAPGAAAAPAPAAAPRAAASGGAPDEGAT